MTHCLPVYRTKDNKMERVTNNRSLEAERYGRAHSLLRHRRSMTNVGTRTRSSTSNQRTRRVDSIDANACSCSLRVLSNVPLHSRLIFPSFFCFSPLFFTRSTLCSLSTLLFLPPFCFFILLAVYSYCSFSRFNNGRLVVLLMRDIRVRRINACAAPFE